MPYLTLTENLKLQLSPGLVASYDISQETEWVYSGTNTHTFTYLLTCPGPTRGFLPIKQTAPKLRLTRGCLRNETRYKQTKKREFKLRGILYNTSSENMMNSGPQLHAWYVVCTGGRQIANSPHCFMSNLNIVLSSL